MRPGGVGHSRGMSADAERSWARNALLAAVAGGTGSTGSETLVLGRGQRVHTAGAPADAVLFPLTCVVSLATGGAGDDTDVTTVGREGLVGLAGLLGSETQDTDAVCRVPGAAVRLPIGAARGLLVDDVQGRAVLHRYVRGSVADLMQRLTCLRLHTSEQRCACWLLKTSDRVGEATFDLTHATLATMLGVRRATVTDSLAALQRSAAVRSRRGTVTVLDRSALRTAACDCYEAFRQALPMTA